MSDNAYFKTRRQEVLGSISGWDRFTTAQAEDSTHIPSNDHEYTLPDLYIMLKKIMSRIDPDQVEYLIKSIQEHINDKDNPHQVSLDKMSTSVIKEMYNLWINEGYTGDEDQFLKQLFQYVKIADLETTYAGKALDQVPSVYTVARSIERHNQSIDAHANLITSMFPGSPLQGPPTYAVLGLVSQAKVPEEVIVNRTGSIWVTNSFGHLIEVEENTIKPDWILGEPSLPIFDSYTSSIVYSEDFSKLPTSTSIDKLAKVNKLTIEKSTSIYSPRNANEFVWFAKESQDTSAVPHYLAYATSVVKDNVYTFSIYVKPINRRGCKIQVHPRLSGVYAPLTGGNTDEGKLSFISYDFINKEIYIPDQVKEMGTMTGGMSEMVSGWWRIWVTFKSQVTERSTNIHFFLSDILGGDFGYVGNGASGAGLFGVQFTNTTTVAPYVPTNASAVTIGATDVIIPINNSELWYNNNASTLIVEVSNSRSNTINNGKPNEVYTLADGSKKSLSCNYPVTTVNYKPFFNVYDQNNKSIVSHYGNENISTRAVLGQTFDTVSSITVSTGGDPITTSISKQVYNAPKYIYLGCPTSSTSTATSRLNGYLFRFEYYPFKCTEDNLRYFLEDPIFQNVVEEN